MKIIIFAGGAGTRLWPISRRNSPKQFEALKDNQSTLQKAIERIRDFGMENIFISTNQNYKEIVHKQIPELLEDNIFTEPAKRDLAGAVLLTLLRLKKAGNTGTVSIIWSDHFMEHSDRFTNGLKEAEELIAKDKERFVFLGEKPRFASHNLGWIQTGEKIEGDVHEFKSWRYRPEVEECKEMFASGEWLWNPGYFVFDIDFVLNLYKQHQPELLTMVSEMVEDDEVLDNKYKDVPAMSFDKAIAEKIDPSQAVVLKVDMGWSDPGTLYALKESLVDSEEKNYSKGKVVVYNTQDSFVYNEDDKKLVTTIGLDGMVVVNTKDALLVCHKDDVPDTKKLLKKLEEEGLEEYL